MWGKNKGGCWGGGALLYGLLELGWAPNRLKLVAHLLRKRDKEEGEVTDILFHSLEKKMKKGGGGGGGGGETILQMF